MLKIDSDFTNYFEDAAFNERARRAVPSKLPASNLQLD